MRIYLNFLSLLDTGKCKSSPSWKTKARLSYLARIMSADDLPTPEAKALYYNSDLMLSQSFQPMAVQLSKKAALPLAKTIATVVVIQSSISHDWCWPSSPGVFRRLHQEAGARLNIRKDVFS